VSLHCLAERARIDVVATRGEVTDRQASILVRRLLNEQGVVEVKEDRTDAQGERMSLRSVGDMDSRDTPQRRSGS
jgi:hypothetical protein